MRSLSSLGIGLSLVFGCLLLALIAELYYLLWWKKRITNTESEDDTYSISSGREFLYLFCWKRPSSLSSTALNPQQLCTSGRITDAHVHDSENSKDFVLKPFEETDVETELMRLHNLAGPPRFLFTIKEETKEDLESEDGKSTKGKSRIGSRSRSLSDLVLAVETPFLTPLSSPSFFTPPHTPVDSSFSNHGLNPLFESANDAADVMTIAKSPPSKFKFLKDAEDKLYRRKLMEEAERKVKTLIGSAQNVTKETTPPTSTMSKDEEDGSYITIFVGKNQEKDHDQHHSSSSQVLPLFSSPSTTTTKTYKKSMFH